MPDQDPERLTDEELSELERLEREAVAAHLRFDELGTNAASRDYNDAEARLRRALRNSARALLSSARREQEQAAHIRELEAMLLRWLQYARDDANRKGTILSRPIIEQITELESRLSGSAR